MAQQTHPWKTTTQSILLTKNGPIAFTPQNVVVTHPESMDCECTQTNCACFYTYDEDGNNGEGGGCVCMDVGQECNEDCKSCAKYPRTNNTQMANYNPVKVKVVEVNEIIGKGLIADEDIKNGQLVGVFHGEIGTYDDIAMTPYSMELGEMEIKIKATGEIIRDVFIMDCSNYGTDMNYCNHTCNNNNTKAYTVKCGPIVQVGVYATTDIASGEYIHWNYGDFYNMRCYCSTIGEGYQCNGWIGKERGSGTNTNIVSVLLCTFKPVTHNINKTMCI